MIKLAPAVLGNVTGILTTDYVRCPLVSPRIGASRLEMTAKNRQRDPEGGDSKVLPEDAFALSYSICFTWGYPDYMREALTFVVRERYASEPQDYVCTTWAELRVLIEQADSADTRYIIAGNPKTPQAVLNYLSKLSDSEVARRVAENSSAHRITLDALAGHGCPEVRAAVAENPATKEETLAKLCRDENSDVRYAMAHNSQTPEAFLRLLLNDENPYVCARANQTLERLAGPHIVQANFARKTLQKLKTLKSMG